MGLRIVFTEQAFIRVRQGCSYLQAVGRSGGYGPIRARMCKAAKEGDREKAKECFFKLVEESLEEAVTEGEAKSNIEAYQQHAEWLLTTNPELVAL